MTKISDLPQGTNLGGIKIKTPDGRVGIWQSQWEKGVWLHLDGDPEGRITPIFVEDLRETLNWEVINT